MTRPVRDADPAPDVVGLGRTVPGLTLRLVLVVAVACAAGVLVLGPPTLPAALLVVALGVLAGAWPGTPLPGAALLGVLVLVVWAGGGLGPGVAAVLVFVHAGHVAAGLAEVVPVRARVETAALGPVLRRFLGVQVASQAVLWTAAVVGALSGTGRAPGLLLALATAALVALACGVAVARRRVVRAAATTLGR